MRLSKVRLFNFRNYAGETELEVGSTNNLLLGRNGQGKSNFLEAVYYLALAHSFRGARDVNLINFGSNFFILGGEVIHSHGSHLITTKYDLQKKKEISVDGSRCRKLEEGLGWMNVVVFAPEHLLLVKGAPGLRRRYIDTLILQTQPKYYRWFRQYNKALGHRNRLLKDRAGEGTLDIWDEQLAAAGARIITARARIILGISRTVSDVFKNIYGSADLLEIIYLSSLDGIDAASGTEPVMEAFISSLKQKRHLELSLGSTAVGPHRDDMAILLNGKPLKDYGSQGQQRSAVLSLKLAEVSFLARQNGEYPILLLDDVMSELDADKRSLVAGSLGKAQTFITATDSAQFQPDFLESAALWKVQSGVLTIEKPPQKSTP